VSQPLEAHQAQLLLAAGDPSVQGAPVWRPGEIAKKALTKDFHETIRDRAQHEPAFRRALLSEAIELMLSGDEKTGRAVLCN
jgi:hypothetical protein